MRNLIPEPGDARPGFGRSSGAWTGEPADPQGKRPWTADPGHIHDAPEPTPMPMSRSGSGSRSLPRRSRPGRRPRNGASRNGEPAPVPDPAGGGRTARPRPGDPAGDEAHPEKRSAAIPAIWAVQRRYGWCTPEGITQAAAVMGVTPDTCSRSPLLRPLRLEPEASTR